MGADLPDDAIQPLNVHVVKSFSTRGEEMKLIAVRSDGAKLYYTCTENERDLGQIEMPDGTMSPEKDILNLSKFNDDWEEVTDGSDQ